MKKIDLIVACLAILAYSFSLAGCDAKKKALQEADQARSETAHPAEEMVEVVEEPEPVEPTIDPNEPTKPDDTL